MCLVNVADKLGEREGSTRVKVGKGCYYLKRLGGFGWAKGYMGLDYLVGLYFRFWVVITFKGPVWLHNKTTQGPLL